MPSPFPGMDPYLEDEDYWPGFHSTLAVEIMAQLNTRIGPDYFAEVEVKVLAEEIGIVAARMIPDVGVLEGSPDPIAGARSALSNVAVAIPGAPIQRTALSEAETRLRSVRIRRSKTDELVTAIEILSPYNKRPGDGLAHYQRKRARLLRSHVHLMEIDLLRRGQRPGPEVNEPPLEAEYILLVNRADVSGIRTSEIWPVALNEPLPLLPTPLLAPDPDVPLDLGQALAEVYKRSAYDRHLDYREPVPPPPLRPEMAAWFQQTFQRSNV